MASAADETPPAEILVADDQQDVLEALRLLLKGEGFRTDTASSPSEVLEAVEQGHPDVVLMDLNYARDTTSGEEGLELLERISRLDAHLPVVVMTAWASIDLAVEAMRRGARDFIEKPWDNSRLLQVLKTQVELGRALKRGERLEAENRALRDDARTSFLARSPTMEPVLELVERIGPSDANVLITGENGTGKNLVARMLHERSARASEPMLTVDVGGLAESVFESELFGHVRGAFTDAKTDRVGRFEAADGGTLFLDEIGNVPGNLQGKLLRVVETGEFERIGSSKTRRVDVRILSATNSDLERQVEEGGFRQDLFFRLKTVEIPIPPLRERREDIAPLAKLFLRRHARRYRRDLTGFDDEALAALHAYRWPGNVRELSHAVERGVLMATGEKVDAGALGITPGRGSSPELEEMTLEEAERHLIRVALERQRGNVSRAAERLGLSRSALYRRLDKYDLETRPDSP